MGLLPARTLDKRVLALLWPMSSITHTFSVLVTEGILSHISKLNGALRARVHKPIAALWMKFRGGNDLSQLLHVCGFDVHNIEALVLNIEIP